ncbi:MAG: type III pantothenate kinase [Desulfovibrio sp.]|jgi:type III pantothenate kinase|nr:type III pantothenate kinase [Desulfovibrio sp.]MBQ2477761.1 type III pantothenate kinase [Desulfovibrio sp.]MBQ4124961.1 type III pantothenate kinase [Desulfovibrio sp.]MCR5171113.1 type III pantothenate kinase [Desulfovibrio sp.]
MQDNLLLFDIGNTTMKVGVSVGGVRRQYTLPTDAGQTADSLGLNLLLLLREAGVAPGSLSACIAASVVPVLDPLLKAACARFIGCPVLFAPQDLPIPLENRYRNPREVGADRLVAGWAARRRKPDAGSLVVVDFGTAVTFDCIEGDAYLGGLIFPGPMTALKALASSTAKLPSISLETEALEPEPCQDTATSIRHGIVFGFAAMVDGLVGQLSRQMQGPCAVVATGGFAQTMARVSRSLGDVAPGLLLDGLEMLYKLQQQRHQQARRQS